MSSFLIDAPGLDNFPATIQHMVQDGILIREFHEPLFPNLRFRACFTPEETDRYIGETFTFSKSGDLPVNINAIDMSAVSDTDLNSGMTPESAPGVEQYSMTISKWGAFLPTNLLASSVSLEDQWARNSQALGRQAGKSLDLAARLCISASYQGGRTWLTAAPAASTTATVENVFGFEFVMVNGVPTPVSVANDLPVTVDGVANTVTAVTPAGSPRAADDHNPGDLTLSVAVTEAIGDPVISDVAPASLRPNGKTTEYNLVAADLPTLDLLLLQEATLEDLNVPPGKDGLYYGYMDSITHTRLYQDAAFQNAFQSQGITDVYGRRALGLIGNTLYFHTNQMPRGDIAAGGGNLTVRRTFVHGGGLGFEGRFNGVDKLMKPTGMNSPLHITMLAKESWIVLQYRAPIDVHGEVATPSWKFLGNWVLATDSLDTSVSPAVYKRGIFSEHA